MQSHNFVHTHMLRLVIIHVVLIFWVFSAQSQCNVTVASTTGYSVTIRVRPEAIIPGSTDCPWGYNYNVRLTYTVSFTGSNIPGSLYTLQGNITCNTSQNSFFQLPLSGGTGTLTTNSNPYISNDGGAYVYTSHPSCNAATVNNLNCNAVNITIDGPGISNRTVNCAFGSPLPIQLLYFTGEKRSGSVVLDWQTQTEKNNSHFTIEKSLDGIEWVPLGTIPGAGNSSELKRYSFSDDDPDAGINYYRLKQTDFDLRYTYSPIIYVINTPGIFYCSNIWPNPVQNEFRFLLSAPESGKADYRLLNEFGAPVKTGEFNYNSGKNDIGMSSEELPSGFYLLEINTGTNKLCRKLVKL